MGGCLLPIFVHSGKHQISPSFCSLVGPYQEIEANFVFGTLKNTKKWNIRSVFIFNLFPSTTKLRTNSLINKVYHFTHNLLSESVFSERRICSNCELSSQLERIETSIWGKQSTMPQILFWTYIFTSKT